MVIEDKFSDWLMRPDKEVVGKKRLEYRPGSCSLYTQHIRASVHVQTRQPEGEIE